MQNPRRMGMILLGVLVAIVSMKSVMDLLGMFAMEAEGPMHSDAGTYALIGRALLNGLKPYTDLFDAKPPGIYLIMAASLWLTNGEMLATWLQMGALLSPPLLLAWCTYMLTRKNDVALTWICTMLAFIGGTVLTLYAEERSGALQPEGFGFAFSMAYGVILLRTDLRSRGSMILASIAMLLSMGMKEPFVFANLAIALLLASSWKDLPRTFLLPLGLAAVIGCMALGALGLLWPYIGVHLPNMLVHRVQEVVEYSPLWLRPLRTGRIFADIVAYYPSGKFTGWMIILLWMSTPLFLLREPRSWKGVFCTWIIMWSALFVMNLLFIVLTLKGMYPDAPVSTIIGQNFAGREYAWIAAAFVGVCVLWRIDRSLLHAIGYTLGILYLVALAVAAGVAYHPNFFVFAVPAYGVLLLLGMREAGERRLPPLAYGALAAVILLAGTFYHPNPKHVEGHAELVQSNYVHSHEDAKRLDALLEACNVQRANVNAHGRSFTFSKHSPWGPLMGLAMPEYFPADHAYGKRTVENILENATIMIFNNDEFYTRPLIQPIIPQVQDLFTQDAPPCAMPHLPFFEYTVLFRKGAV
ncbi:hypothetical protein FJZ27_04780 [Candidatus Peribacteria bacterium]|nr:hypothetical protein [Candidatus Peribacteria bacterium]